MKSVGLAVLSVLAVLGAWLVLRAGVDRGGPPREETPGELGTLSQGSDPPAEPPTMPLAPFSGRVLPPAILPAGKVPEEAAGEVEFVLEVVTSTTREPLADVEVRFELAGARPRITRRARTDEAGVARVRLARERSYEATARPPGWFGRTTFRTDAPRARLVLEPNWDLCVEVVAHDGSPAAGVPISVGPRRGRSEAHETDDLGVAWVEGFRELLQEHGTTPLWAEVLLPLAERLEQPIPADWPATEPLRFRLPPVGAVALAVLEFDGRPVGTGVEVRLRSYLPDEVHRESLFQGSPRPTGWSRVREGQVRFEHVGLGLDLALEADRMHERATLELPGPRSAGELVTGELRFGLEQARLLFRAVAPDGTPLRGSLRTSVRQRDGGSETMRGSEVELGENGSFEVIVDCVAPAESRRELSVVQKEPARIGVVDLSRPFPPGPVPMGDLVLREAPLLVSGRVVDGDGAPVAGGSVSLAFRDEQDRPRMSVALADPLASAADGSFTLRGAVEAPRLQLRARKEGLLSKLAVVAVGTEGVELVLEETGTLEVEVLMDPGLMPSAVHVELRGPSPLAASVYGRRGRGKSLGNSHSFELLRPGVYALRASLDDELLLERSDLALATGSNPRQTLDLRGRLRQFTLELVPPAPGFELSGELRFGPAGAPSRERRVSLDGPRLHLVTTLPRVDASLHVEGCRPEELRELAPRSEVRLRLGLAVRLTLPPELELPRPPLSLGVALVQAPAVGRPQLFDERRELLLHVSEPGVHRVHWYLDRRDVSGGFSSGLPLAARDVTVVEQEGEQILHLELTNAELSAAMSGR